MIQLSQLPQPDADWRERGPEGIGGGQQPPYRIVVPGLRERFQNDVRVIAGPAMRGNADEWQRFSHPGVLAQREALLAAREPVMMREEAPVQVLPMDERAFGPQPAEARMTEQDPSNPSPRQAAGIIRKMAAFGAAGGAAIGVAGGGLLMFLGGGAVAPAAFAGASLLYGAGTGVAAGQGYIVHNSLWRERGKKQPGTMGQIMRGVFSPVTIPVGMLKHTFGWGEERVRHRSEATSNAEEDFRLAA